MHHYTRGVIKKETYTHVKKGLMSHYFLYIYKVVSYFILTTGSDAGYTRASEGREGGHPRRVRERNPNQICNIRNIKLQILGVLKLNLFSIPFYNDGK